ncbi:Clavaminate synthase-like protein [Irpex rosettiformis]|uniref:Clavaminate synthase-like protein n=1 Tax=Irpex rosettiformis TaxID=378272 RepID=A0ACB8UG51_9APHY|nr:Clavaminate synthase-like protein [Irpex rosettiformis]
MNQTSQDVMKWISEEYYDLNGSHFDTIDALPSALEFSQLIRTARPVLIKDCPAPKAFARWTDEYLAKSCGDSPISVAVTPNGRADAITQNEDGRLYFAEPLVEQMTMKGFLAKLASVDSEVLYLQSQDGNLFSSNRNIPSEFHKILSDVPEHLPFCTEALDNMPDAVNLWIGSSKSVTSIHSDPYENIYSVIRGSKTFTVFPPTEGWCMEERVYPHATYLRVGDDSELILVPSEEPPVRWSSITDPTDPKAISSSAHPITITVQAGQSLYLPAGWWHYVRQTEMTIAVNYWYDMESRGSSWVWLNLLRGGASNVSLLPGNEGDDIMDDEDDSEEDEP